MSREAAGHHTAAISDALKREREGVSSHTSENVLRNYTLVRCEQTKAVFKRNRIVSV